MTFCILGRSNYGLGPSNKFSMVPTWSQHGQHGFNAVPMCEVNVASNNVVAQTRGQHGLNMVPTQCQRGVTTAPTWCQHGVNVFSTWCQGGVNMVLTQCQHSANTALTRQRGVSVCHQRGVNFVPSTCVKVVSINVNVNIVSKRDATD